MKHVKWAGALRASVLPVVAVLATFLGATTAPAEARHLGGKLYYSQIKRYAQHEARDFADVGESHGVNDWERISKYRIDVQIYSYDEYDDMTCTAWVTFQKDSPRSVVWSSPRGIDCNSGESGV